MHLLIAGKQNKIMFTIGQKLKHTFVSHQFQFKSFISYELKVKDWTKLDKILVTKKKKIHMKFKLPVILFPISKVQGRNGKKAILSKLCRKR